MLETIKLTKRFNDQTAVHKLSLTIQAGEIFALLGPNGAGKTTTINLLLGFLSPEEGEARVDGANVADDPISARRKLAYIPEQVMLYPRFSGIENLDYFSSLGGRKRSRAELIELLARAGLPEEPALRRVSTYSKGMRQKVGIALALATEAKALLLDEPTSGLDPAASHEFSQLLRQLANDGVAVLMATHDLFRSREVGTRIGIMKRGELVAQLDASDVSHTDLERIYLEHMHD